MLSQNDYGLVADLYDTYVPATFDIPFFLGQANKWPGQVLELMAGTGRVSLPLVEAGVRLTCVDKSSEMLAILRDKLASRGLEAAIYQADVRELDLGKQFDLVMIPFHSFAHILSPADQRTALNRIREHLSPNGCFICTLGNPAPRGQAVDGRLRLHSQYPRANGRGTLLLWILENHSSADKHIVETREFFEEYDERGVLESKRLLEIHFRLTSRAEFEELAAAAGFKVIALYGDYAYAEFHEESSHFMIWELQKTEAV